MSAHRFSDMATPAIYRSARRGLALRIAAMEMLHDKGHGPVPTMEQIDFQVELWLSKAHEVSGEDFVAEGSTKS